jgi:hypothetical protein
MRTSFETQQLARFRVARGSQYLPRDLADWVLDRLEMFEEPSPTVRRRRASRLLIDAALLIDGPTFTRARAVAALLDEIESHGRLSIEIEAGGRCVRGTLARALLTSSRLPRSAKQIARLIHGQSRVVMSTARP